MPDFEKLFAIGNSKTNKTIKLTELDRKSGMKVFCQEDYAQELYDMLSGSQAFASPSKDLEVGNVYTVKLKSVNKDNVVHAHEINTFTSLFIPIRELIDSNPASVDALLLDGGKIKVIVSRKEDGVVYASEKQCAAITYRQELEELFKSDQYFTVKVTDLIDGGYITKFKNEIRCFLPGSQAAANVIHDFQELLGKEIPVMIENYDASNNLFIVSYKKYIRNTIGNRINDIRFGQKLTGKLTANPLDFGIFIEWDNYFTGLVHFTEFASKQDYFNYAKDLKAGSVIDFYVKDITFKKGGEPRIVLTLDVEAVSEDRLNWQNLKDLTENKVLDFTFDRDSRSLEVILPDDTVTNIPVDVEKVRHLIKKSTQIKVDKIDVFKHHIKYNFVTK